MTRILLFPLLLGVSSMASAESRPNEREGVTRVQVRGGDPAKPAILDATGEYSSKYIKKASKVSPVQIGGKRWVSAVFPVKLHKKEQVCENRAGEIHPYGLGFMIVEYSSFFDASASSNEKSACRRRADEKEVSAPTVEHYQLGKWAVRALKEPVIAMAGRADDPLCVKHSMVSCPDSSQRDARYSAAQILQIGSCPDPDDNCIAVTLRFQEKLTKEMTGTEILDFIVRYRELESSAKLELLSFGIGRSPSYAPMLPGPPAIVTANPASN
jgi:hypothetical protein